MTNFGDDEEADAYDPTASPDPEQVARKLWKLRRAKVALAKWDDLSDTERSDETSIIGELLAWLRREGSLR